MQDHLTSSSLRQWKNGKEKVSNRLAQLKKERLAKLRKEEKGRKKKRKKEGVTSSTNEKRRKTVIEEIYHDFLSFLAFPSRFGLRFSY